MSKHEVTIRFIVEYEGPDRYFDPEDVRYLAREGVESHYEVIESAVIPQRMGGSLPAPPPPAAPSPR
jgi:hypothetical protein